MRPQTSAGLARRLRDLPVRAVLGIEVPVATGFSARLLGLAGLPSERAGVGLLLPRCRSVHTLGMRFALDLIFLDRDDRVVGVVHAIGPGRVVAERGASAVLELQAAGRGGGVRPAQGRELRSARRLPLE